MESLFARIKAEHPGKPFIALGQTVLWDEPMKAVWCQKLIELYPEAKFIAGVHDTDYFAKTSALIATNEPYAMLAHDDLLTRGLWSAAGEMSSLFGSEDLMTLSDYKAQGISLKLASAVHSGYIDLASKATEAWGWRGLVSTGPKQVIARDVILSDVVPALIEQIDWAYDSSAQCLPLSQKTNIADAKSKLIEHLKSLPPESTLTEAYKALLPRLYSDLLRREHADFATTVSSELFKFNTQTAHLARFNFVNHFLNPKTRGLCCNSYDNAVKGGGMYTLEEFGPGALPFDIVLPGVGRGTLHVTASQVTIDLPGEKAFKAENVTITNVNELAQLLEAKLGTEIALVGKAVSLISMLASEFIIVFHETASGYTDRTAMMNDSIRKSRILLNLAPIVRIQYETWDSLRSVGDKFEFKLPQHLAIAFGQESIAPSEFASRWRSVVDLQTKELVKLKSRRSPRALMQYLHDVGDVQRCWNCDIEAYDNAAKTLAERSAELQVRRDYVKELRRERYEMRSKLNLLQLEMGAHFRKELLNTAGRPKSHITAQLYIREHHYQHWIDILKRQIRQSTRVIKALRSDIRLSEHEESTHKLRTDMALICKTAELSKLTRVRAAFITSKALPHINSRPSAWWMNLVDPSGNWFNTIATTASARLEVV